MKQHITYCQLEIICLQKILFQTVDVSIPLPKTPKICILVGRLKVDCSSWKNYGLQDRIVLRHVYMPNIV